ncbi:MAG: hypothetical protein U0O39_12720, partial [Akkermansia sp.]
EIRDIRALEAKINELDELKKEKEALIKSVLDEAGVEERGGKGAAFPECGEAAERLRARSVGGAPALSMSKGPPFSHEWRQVGWMPCSPIPGKAGQWRWRPFSWCRRASVGGKYVPRRGPGLAGKKGNKSFQKGICR